MTLQFALPVIVLTTAHSLLSCLQRFRKPACNTAGSGSVLTGRGCCAAVAISITTVPRWCVKPRLSSCRALCRRSWRSWFGPRSRRCRWGWRSCGCWRRWRGRLLDLFEVGGRCPAGGGVIKAFSQPPSCETVSTARLDRTLAYHTIVFFLRDQDHLIFPQTELATRLAGKVVEGLELRVLWRRRRSDRM